MKEPVWKKFVKFAIVGGTGAFINFFLTYAFTEWLHIWYMFSLVLATIAAMVWNFYLNYMWTFANMKSMDEPDYEWYAFFNGNPIQKWWKKQIAQKVAAMVEGENILDFGCGSSPMCTMLNGQCYYGLDANSEKIAFMSGLKLKNRNFATESFDAFEIKAINNKLPQFDTTMTIEVIEHMPNRNRAQSLLNCLSRATVKGGVVIIATPNYDSKLWRIIERIYGILMYNAYASDHSTRLNEYILIRMAMKAGLTHEFTDTVLGADMVCKFRKVNDVVLV